eukprot:6467799-Amphidinium_carterae.1
MTQASSHLHMHRSIPQDMQFFLAEVKERAPHLVWIQYRGAGMPGRRTQVKAFRHYVSDLLKAQPQVLLVVEARSCDLPVREELMQHASWDALLRPAVTVRSCTLHTLAHCCGYMARANFSIPPAQTCATTCIRRQAPSSDHAVVRRE